MFTDETVRMSMKIRPLKSKHRQIFSHANIVALDTVMSVCAQGQLVHHFEIPKGRPVAHLVERALDVPRLNPYRSSPSLIPAWTFLHVTPTLPHFPVSLLLKKS